MGQLRWFAKRQPTPEQSALLEQMTNPQQRAAILRCIENGEDIPPYAWTPLPADLDCAKLAREAQERFANKLAEDARTDPEARKPLADILMPGKNDEGREQ